jgi:hypothetical protein
MVVKRFLLCASENALRLGLNFLKDRILGSMGAPKKFANGGETLSAVRFRKRIAPWFEFFEGPHSWVNERFEKICQWW